MRRYPTITYSYHSICFSSLLIETATEQFFCILCQKHKRRLGYWKKRVLYFDIFANQNICQWQAQQPAKNEKKEIEKCSSSWRKKMFNSSLFSSEKGLILADFCTSSKTPWDGSNMAMVCSGLYMMCEPGYCHGSAKGCHHGHTTSQSNSRSSTFSKTETKFKFISLPLRKVAQEKMVWAGRATAIPPNFTFFSGRLARHRSILLRMNWNFWYPRPWKQTQNFEIYCQLFFFQNLHTPFKQSLFYWQTSLFWAAIPSPFPLWISPSQLDLFQR